MRPGRPLAAMSGWKAGVVRIDNDEVDGPHQFVGEGDDRLLVAAAKDQALVLGAEDGLGSPCGVGGLAQKITNDGIAVAGLTALTLAGRLVVAGTQGAPRRQARRGSEPMGIVADLDQNHG